MREALAALGAGDARDALDALLAAWRMNPTPELAEAIDEVGLRSNDEVTRLLANVCASNAAAALERMTVVERLPRDPRTARAILGWVADPPYHATSSRPFWRVALRVLEATADPSLRERLVDAAVRGSATIHGATMRTWLQKSATAVSLPTVLPAPLSAADAATLSEAVHRFRPTTKTAVRGARGEEELLRSIQENPEDDATRAVYADVLLERGDPRGEFIQLQLARTSRALSEGEAKRERALLLGHLTEWLGEAASLGARLATKMQLELDPEQITAPAFHRGFLAGFALAPPPFGQATGSKLGKLAGHASFATVEDFVVNPTFQRNYEAPSWPIAEFLSHPGLRAMRRLAVPTRVIPALARGPHASRITLLETLDYQNADEMHEAMEACAGLPSLRWVRLIAVAGGDSVSSDEATLARWQERVGSRVTLQRVTDQE